MFVDEAENVEFEPGIVFDEELPPLGCFHRFEVIGEELHASEVEIRCVAEARELQHVHHVLCGQALGQTLDASLFQLRHQVHVRQCEQVHPVLVHHLLSAPAGGISVILQNPAESR